MNNGSRTENSNEKYTIVIYDIVLFMGLESFVLTIFS